MVHAPYSLPCLSLLVSPGLWLGLPGSTAFFVLARLLPRRYAANTIVYGLSQMIESASLLNRKPRPHLFGASGLPSLLAGWIAAVILIVLLCGVTAGAAQAHVFHDLEVPHAAAVPDHPISAEGAEGDAAAPVAVDSSDCSITCCSTAHCAAGLAGSCQTAALDRAAADRFALPGAMKAGAFEQGARQRPPRS